MKTTSRWMIAVAMTLSVFTIASAAPTQDEVLAAIRIPTRVDALVKQGLSRAEAAKTMRTFNERRVASTDADVALEAVSERDLGRNVSEKMPNFGDFVTQQVQSGLKGQALAAAIHTELRARGVPVPEHAGTRGSEASSRRQNPERPTAGRPENPGRSGGAGQRPSNAGGRR